MGDIGKHEPGHRPMPSILYIQAAPQLAHLTISSCIAHEAARDLMGSYKGGI